MPRIIQRVGTYVSVHADINDPGHGHDWQTQTGAELVEAAMRAADELAHAEDLVTSLVEEAGR